MFMDTPKLQPISNKPKTSEQHNNVPSQSDGGSGTKNKNFGASSLANDNKGDTRNNNTNSYRKNNCGPNFPKNFKSRITGDCHPKNFQRNHLTYHNSNNNNSNNRPNWKNNIWNNNSNIIHWTPKFNNNNNPFRKINNYTNSTQRFDSNRLNSDSNECTSTFCEDSSVANCDSSQTVEGNSESPAPDNNSKKFNNSKRSPPKRPYKGTAKKPERLEKPAGKSDQSQKPPPVKKAKFTHQAKPAKVISPAPAPPPTRANFKQTKKTQPRPKREFKPKSPRKKPKGKQNNVVPQTTCIASSTTSALAATNTTPSASAESTCGNESKSNEDNNSKSIDSDFSKTKLANISQESLSKEVSANDSSSLKDSLPVEEQHSEVVNSEPIPESIITPAPASTTSQTEQQQTIEISESCSAHLEIQDIDLIYQHMTNVLDYKSDKEAENDIDILLEQPQQQSTVLPATTNAVTGTTCPVETQSESDPKEFQFPKISLIPISRLIASEFWETPREESLTFDTCPKTPSAPSTPHKHAAVFKPNLIKRKRNVSTCSNTSTSSNTASAAENIVDKLVTMNKINIKDIINNTGTKYDEALKLQARKRLREEIRRQLKSMNIEPTKDPVNSEFVPDEIVDSMNIPDFVLEEIRKVLGYDILQLSANIKGENVGPEDSNTMVNRETTGQLTNSLAVKGNGSAETPIIIDDHPPATTPVKMEPITIAAGDKTKDHKKTKRYRKHKESHTKKSGHKKRPQKHESISNEIIVLDSSSNSSGHSSSSSSSSSSSTSSSSSSSSSSSDSESDTSKKSTSSAIKRKRLKLKVDAENVVDSFEKLILPSLSDSLNERYRAKYSNSTNTKLHFISCICVSEYNSEKFSKMEVAKIQRNLKSADCSMALEFLMREIVNVFNKQKQVAKMGEQNGKSGRKQAAATSEEETQQRDKDAGKQKPMPASKVINGGAPSPDTTKSVEAAQTPNDEDEDDNANASTIQKCVSKVLSLYRQEMKAAASQQQQQQQQQKSTVTTVASPQQATVAQHQSEDCTANQHTSNSDTSSTLTALAPASSAAAPAPSSSSTSVSVAASCFKNASNGIKLHKDESAQHHLNRISQLQRETENQFNHIRTLTNLTSSDYNLLPIDTNSIRFNSSIFDFPSSSFTQPPTFPALDLEMLKKQSPIGEAVVSNLREIDVKLMELHKRKMYIEEMILKLQKDKMDTDLLTIKLQNEKFILLNTAMTANVTTSTAASNATAMEKCPGNLTDTLLNLKNIKTETVEIPDDEQPPAKATPTKRKVIEEPAPPPAPPSPKICEEPAPSPKVSEQTVPTHKGSDDTTSSSKVIDIPPSKRKSHINKVTTSGRAKRKTPSSDSTTIGETFKRLRQQAQKASSENREVSSTATKNVTPHDRANEEHENHRIGNGTHENHQSHVKSKNSEDDKIIVRRNSEARNHSKTRKTEDNPQRRNSDVRKCTSKTSSPTQTAVESEEHHPQGNTDVKNQHHLKTSPLGSTNLQGDVPTPSPKHTDSEVRPPEGRCYSEEKLPNTAKPNGETLNGSASVSPFANDANQPSTSTATPPLPPLPLPSASDPTTSQDADEVIDLMSLYKNMPCRLVEGLQSPIAQIRVFENTILASSEDGKIYTFNASTLELMNTFNKHTEAITQMYLCHDKRFLFTTSLDGYMKKSQLENLSSGTQSVYLKEPLQTLDIQWDTAYAGSRWGNIYMCHILANIRSASLLCSTESSIITIKAAKEGARKVLIVSSKGNVIHVRDATSGLLLRTFDVPDCINIYSILLNESILYCGTQKKEIRKYDFVSGAPVGSITCGNGAVSMLMFRNKYMFVGCYDGFIYIIDKVTGRQVTRLTGSGKMILTLEIVGDKIITSAKDTTMKVINIPTFCLTDSL